MSKELEADIINYVNEKHDLPEVIDGYSQSELNECITSLVEVGRLEIVDVSYYESINNSPYEKHYGQRVFVKG